MESLFSTSYLPPISYIAHIRKYTNIYIENFETYSKQTFRNRCEILSANGKLSLSVPIIKSYGNHTLTKDIKICYSQAWQRIHWNAICSAYNKSPFFLYYRDFFEPIYLKKHDFLVDLNEELLSIVFKILRSNVFPIATESYVKHHTDADDYREYFDKKMIAEDLYFMSYYQVFADKHGFMSNLSIIDLLFNLGNDSVDYLNNISKKNLVK